MMAWFFLVKGKTAASPAQELLTELKTNAKGFSEGIHPGDSSTMVLIPEGEFTMGSDDYSAEKPVQKIFLDKYYIDKYLVTNAQFQKFVEATNGGRKKGRHFICRDPGQYH